MQTEMVIQHPDASMPLRVPLTVVVNTPEETILANVLHNSKRTRKWAKQLPAHDDVAVICGGGPSLGDQLLDVFALRNTGAKIFALNAAASFLSDHGIKPDYQVILDAKPETVELFGPAKEYLFASQVDPALFDKAPDATLWHASHGELMVDEQEGFPKHDDDYCVIGGAVSVGNSASVLAYVMGYREIHIFGMDSSHRSGKSHAYRQGMNDGDPCTVTELNGREFVSSVTMKLQAEYFMGRYDSLTAAGCKITVHGDGLLPEMVRARQEPITEQEKYERMWCSDAYREVSPGELAADNFVRLVKPKGRVIDFGCGTGRGALRLRHLGCDVLMVDFASNCLDAAARYIPFVLGDLTEPMQVSAQYGYCTDVLEHIPTDDVDDVILNVMDAAPKTYFQISTVPDQMGTLIGKQLHLTVKPHEWWEQRFLRAGYFIDWQEKTDIHSSFLVSRSPRKRQETAA